MFLVAPIHCSVHMPFIFIGMLATVFLDIVLAFSIQALLSAPNPDDPLSDNIAKHWKSNEAEAVETGKLKLTN